jgi:hypothetical protein
MIRFYDRATQLHVWLYVNTYADVRASTDTLLAHTEAHIAGMPYYEAEPSNLIPAPLSDNYIY